MLSEYRDADLIPALVLAGVTSDLLLARFSDTRIRLFALLLPPVLWAIFFLCVELLATARLGADAVGRLPLAATAGLGYAMSLLVFPPYNTIRRTSPDG